VLLCLPASGGRIDLGALGAALVARGVRSLLVEGGGETHAAFLEAGCADRVAWFVAPKIAGGVRAVPSVAGRGVARIAEAVALSDLRVRRAGDGIVLHARVHRPR
jgi:diaminohydroxyphosphoribosylaminopyrimidine deaminase/5-amino-6-(5-phosphoribosylamino)uracil reductase